MKNSQKRRSARSVGAKSAGVAARRAGGGGREGPSAGTRSGNMGGKCTPIQEVDKGRYVAYRKDPSSYRDTHQQRSLDDV